MRFLRGHHWRPKNAFSSESKSCRAERRRRSPQPSTSSSSHLEAEQAARFAGTQLDQLCPVEAKRTLLELIDQVIGDADVRGQRGHGFTARHEAFSAVLDDKAVLGFTRKLAPDFRACLEQRHSIPCVCTAQGDGEPGDAAADHRETLHVHDVARARGSGPRQT